MTRTPRQRAILDWFGRTEPHAAHMFESALRIAADERIPCRGRMIGHACREICSMLMARYSSNSRQRLETRLDQFVAEFKDLSIPVDFEEEGTSPTKDPPPKLVPDSFLRAAADLARTHSIGDNARARARKMFESLVPRGGRPQDMWPTADRWLDMSRFFEARCHDRTTPDVEMMNGQFRLEVEFFEDSLNALARSAAENLDDLDDILERANS